MTKPNFYSVAILSPETNTWEYSRAFDRKAPAIRWAKWCATRWATKLYQGRPGELLVAEFAPKV